MRVSTSCYPTDRGFIYTKKVDCLKRKSELRVNDFIDSFDLECLPYNLLDVKDGLYRLEFEDFSYDPWSGEYDCNDLKLLPYEESGNT